MTPPAIILVSPQMGENIGAAARVMANFALSDLRLVAPRDGWPNPAAETMSAGAFPDHVTARVFDTLEDAIADCTTVIATTARPRGIERLRVANGQTAVLFGAEKSGLSNEAVTLCDAILTYPVSVEFSSLNLAQSVAVLAHAWRDGFDGDTPNTRNIADAPATRDELVGMMQHFEDELDRAGFFFPDVKKPVMVQNLRNTFTRANWTSQEVRTFRGAIKALAIGRGKARITREKE